MSLDLINCFINELLHVKLVLDFQPGLTQSQKKARSCPCSENKGADQLCSYCKGDLCLCFRICKMLVSCDAAQVYCTQGKWPHEFKVLVYKDWF